MEYGQDKKDWFGNWANEYDQTIGKVKRHHGLLDLAVEPHVKSNASLA